MKKLETETENHKRKSKVFISGEKARENVANIA